MCGEASTSKLLGDRQPDNSPGDIASMYVRMCIRVLFQLHNDMLHGLQARGSKSTRVPQLFNCYTLGIHELCDLVNATCAYVCLSV